ncbi:pentatricopeptide repeat-containing protein At3g21470 [Lycium ferocissimum]|uniref:pentatricopeptide repeat-containing protein At3g21470 n=1 Tax=Lycium ferocissimum TaxID=112874 RepID=UPI0028149992|nr:pentatricopeptide repeat-containing protein At3g21470 [Lycium ferocissimum]
MKNNHQSCQIQSSGLDSLNNITNPLTNWSYNIKNYISQRKFKQALLIYTHNRINGSSIMGAIPLVLKACASLTMLSFGKSLHVESLKSGFNFNVMVGTALLDMYGKCGEIESARKVFDYMPERNVITWNAMIGGYMKSGDVKTGFLLFENMSEKTIVTWNEMIDGYARNGDMVMARWFFNRVPDELRNVVTWSVMVDGYASNGDMDAARELFEMMPRRNFYVWSSMVSGYFKKGDVENAEEIFARMTMKNLVNWNSLICGYTQNGLCEEALEAFREMQDEGFEPDEVTVVSVLSACAQLALLDVGKDIHEMIIRKGIELNQYVLNGLVDMYAKCGDLSNARLIFEGMLVKNDAAWNSLLSGFANHGYCMEAINLFERMDSSGVKPNDITFLSVLSACAHGGFVEEGLEVFSRMEKYALTASIKHYGCLIDLLGRAGRLKEACDLIKGMPFSPNDTVFGALLGACRVHSDTDVAENLLKEVSSSDSGDDAHYVILSNVYAAAEKWEKAERMRFAMSNKGSQKTPGCSVVMLDQPTTNFMEVLPK